MSGFYVNGTDLDDIFIKKSSAYPGTNTSSSASQTHFEVDGVDLNQRYVAKANTYPNNGMAAATGLLVDGADLNAIFAKTYEWGTYTVQAAGSKGYLVSTSNTRFGNNPNVNSQYGAIITCEMDLIKTYNGSPVYYEIKNCQGGAGGTVGYGTRVGGNGGDTVALIDPNNDECIIVAGAGGGSGNGNGGPGGAAYNDTLNMTDWNNPIFYYLIQDPLLTKYMYPGGETLGYPYTGIYPYGGDYINQTLKVIKYNNGGSAYWAPPAGYYYGLNAKNCFTYGGGGGTDEGGVGGIDGGAAPGTQWNGGKGGDANSDSRSAGGGGGGAGYYGGGGGTNVNTGDGTRGSPGGGGGSSYINPNYNLNNNNISIVANGTSDYYIKIDYVQQPNGFTL
jgi:hypothetical protein